MGWRRIVGGGGNCSSSESSISSFSNLFDSKFLELPAALLQ